MNVDKLFKQMQDDMMNQIDSFAVNLCRNVSDFVKNAYLNDCASFWPIVVEGQQIVDPDTGKPYTEECKPSVLSTMVKDSVTKGEFSRTVKIWLGAENSVDGDKFIRVGQMMEAYGCRPWSRLNGRTANEIFEMFKK